MIRDTIDGIFHDGTKMSLTTAYNEHSMDVTGLTGTAGQGIAREFIKYLSSNVETNYGHSVRPNFDRPVSAAILHGLKKVVYTVGGIEDGSDGVTITAASELGGQSTIYKGFKAHLATLTEVAPLKQPAVNWESPNPSLDDPLPQAEAYAIFAEIRGEPNPNYN